MLKDYEFWFIVGSQFLYGPEVLETVASRAQEMADALNVSGNLPCKLVYKVTAKTNKEIAEALFISENTVKFHMRNLLKKTDCKKRGDVIKLFHEYEE